MVEKSEQVRASGQGKNAEYLPLFSGITFEQIAFHPDQITDDTKVFIGSLIYYDSEGKLVRIFDKLKNVKNIYTSFPEGRVLRQNLEIGGFSHEYLMSLLHANILVLRDGTYPSFTTLDEPERIETVRLKVRELGLKGKPTYMEINARAQELGLELCPAEVGAYKRLVDTNQQQSAGYFIGMEPIYHGGLLTLFNLNVKNDESGLSHKLILSNISNIYIPRDPDDEFVFCMPRAKN